MNSPDGRVTRPPPTAVLFAVLIAGSRFLSGCCDTSGCDALGRPAESVTIQQGIAGVAAYASDAIEFSGCADCTLTDGVAVQLFSTAFLLDSAESVEATVRDELPTSEFSIDKRYERSLEAGPYLACVGAVFSSFICMPVEVSANQVTSLHVGTTFGDPRLLSYAPSGESQGTTFRVQLEQDVLE